MFGGKSKVKDLVFSFFIFGASLLLLSCAPSDPATDKDLSYRSPFGLTWQNTDNIRPRKGHDFLPDNPSHLCGRPSERLEKFLGASLSAEYLKQCESTHFSDDYVLSTKVAKRFRDGSIRVSYNANNKPFLYHYSYGHEIAPALQLKDARHDKYNLLYGELINLYGNPIIKGDLLEGDYYGFYEDYGMNQSCSIWTKKSIVIILCNELVQLIDGIETALVFINLNAHPDASTLASTLDLDWEPKVEPKENVFLSNEEHIRTLLNWTGESYGEDFPGCKKDGNIPLSERAKVSADTIKLLQPLLSKYSGQSLMEYIYEHVIEIEEIVPDANIENVITYLIFTAAQDGSGGAYNEIGASLLYCYQDVQQNYDEAIIWFEKAITKKEPLAYRSMALLHIMGKTESIASRKEAMELLERCSEIDPEACSAELAALKWVERLHSE